MSEKANDCGCSIHSRIRPSDGASIPYRQTENCRYPALLAELNQQEKFNAAFAEKLNEFGTVDRLVEAYSAMKMQARTLEQERDALAGEVRRAQDDRRNCCNDTHRVAQHEG